MTSCSHTRTHVYIYMYTHTNIHTFYNHRKNCKCTFEGEKYPRASNTLWGVECFVQRSLKTNNIKNRRSTKIQQAKWGSKFIGNVLLWPSGYGRHLAAWWSLVRISRGHHCFSCGRCIFFYLVKTINVVFNWTSFSSSKTFPSNPRGFCSSTLTGGISELHLLFWFTGRCR